MMEACYRARRRRACRTKVALVLACAAALALLPAIAPAAAELTREHIRSMTEQMRAHRSAWTDRDTTALLSLAGSGEAVVTVSGDDGQPRRILVSGGDLIRVDLAVSVPEAAPVTQRLGAWFIVAVLLSMCLSLSVALNLYLLRAPAQRGTGRAEVIRSVSRL